MLAGWLAVKWFLRRDASQIVAQLTSQEVGASARRAHTHTRHSSQSHPMNSRLVDLAARLVSLRKLENNCTITAAVR